MTPRDKPKEGPMVKTTLILPRKAWEAAKIQAVRDGVSFNDVIIAAVVAYLKRKGKGGQR